MYLNRLTRIQLVVFMVIAAASVVMMAVGYMNLPAMLFGIGRYDVTVELERSGGLYERGNVTYRGTEVGQVRDVQLTEDGARAILSIDSKYKIPSDLEAEVHSQTAIGELYVALIPRNGAAPPLAEGDVIPVDRTRVPPDINQLLDATNRGLTAIPQDNLQTVIDESYTAVGGLGPELARIVKGGSQLAIDAERELAPMVTLIEQSKPVLDTQIETAGAIQSWAANVAAITRQLQVHDTAVEGVLAHGAATADEARQLMERLRPTLPVLLANLVSVEQVALDYQPALEQLLVLLPQGTAMMGALGVPNLNTKQDYTGMYLDFNLNINLPPPCNTGFLPPQQQRSPAHVDSPERTTGSLYCRVPQDHPLLAVRGARNTPCLTVPGKRAPTAQMCESDEQYVPLNDGYNWKGDPNATLSGQGVPQMPPGQQPEVAAATYDPDNGSYTGPDGNMYTRTDLATNSAPESWQDLLAPRGN
ncbi:MCE family protein [Mycolicibacterium diernhoferi]|uniref:MCE family protein n=1 Tax=Mycolicibacterium diernhoferi TaxID=1801 RepID=A0A1Q4HI83_9MYCO|nr:MlaD family protein [Mycolicibacterium diernhoferi]OJZ67195.1 mammalian cell entry protein [Mycolicibacterium diernhoferi]OPE45357.1 mammalian cell entry protein [Mycolicibacterium diernhoferi]PEG52601.1 MCE family protein [Mycolicibacterium diernhoferi]QYL23394.1 MCE family protein [Mycolicibacterium diernhoferi]